MDFTAFNTVAGAEAGANMPILNPVTGEPIMHGEEPCVVIVRGTESPTVQAALAALRKARLAEKKAAKDNETEADKSMAELHDEMVEAAVPLIMGFQHVSLGDRPLAATDAREFLNLNKVMLDLGEDGKPKSLSFVEQVLRFAGQRANFLPKPATAQRSGSGSSAGSTPNAKP